MAKSSTLCGLLLVFGDTWGRYSMLTYLFPFRPKILIVDFLIGGDSRMVWCGKYEDVHVIGALDLSIFISEMAFMEEMPLYITCGHSPDTHAHTHTHIRNIESGARDHHPGIVN